MRSGPSAFSLVPGMLVYTGSTTVPIRFLKALSAMLKVKSDGIGCSIACPKSERCLKFSIFGWPPVVMATRWKAICLISETGWETEDAPDRFPFPFEILKSRSRRSSSSSVMAVSWWLHCIFTPSRLAVFTRQLMMLCESCVCGNTHWSSCVTRGTPFSSNQSKACW